MKCYTNEDNPITLKLLIASNFGQKAIDVEYVAVKEWKIRGISRLPVIEIDNGTRIFSSNAAARYLFKPSDKISETVDLWLEWESSVLRPVLVKCNPEKITDISILSLLKHLETALQNKNFLIGDAVSLADIAVWSSLFGVITQQTLVTQYFADKNSILTWFDRIRNLEPVNAAIKKWGSKTGAEVLKSFLETNWYPSITQPAASAKISDEEGDMGEKVSNEELKKVKETWVDTKSSRPKPTILTAPVLPKAGVKNVFVTSALPYVNNVPHLGNIIGCVLSADVFVRYCKLRNWNTLYIGGTDEYGTATETKALEENLTPQEICDKYFVIHRDTYAWFNIEFDYFGRTTTHQQKMIAQELFMDLHKNHFTSVASVEQLKCVACDRFLADRFVEGTCPNCKFEDARGDQCDGCGHLINAVELIKPRCKLCGTMPIVQNSDHIFLELPKIEPVLQKWIENSSPDWSHNSRTITNTWLKDGLKPRCITRDLKWGTPVPLSGFENKVFYVWFDAPIGYLSITANYTDQWRKWWQPAKDTPITYYQFMAKDNVPFHSVIFPATLLAINKNYLLVNNIMATEYLNYEDGKFSKSRGVGVFGTDAKNTGLPADIFRFYLLYVRPESQDTSFSWLDLATKHNTELLNNIGNFVNRALVFNEKYFDSLIPAMNMNVDDFTVLAFITRELCAYNAVLEKGKLRDGIKYILNISRHGNQYMQNQKPWVSVKGSPDDLARAGTVIGVSCNIACLLAIVMQPFMPKISQKMREQLNAPEDVMVLTNEVNILLPQGHRIGKPSPLFTKIELNTVEALKKQFSGRQKSTSPAPDQISLSTDSPLNLKNQPKAISTLKEMEDAVAEQGNLVRKLKGTGVDKSEWTPHVNVLKDMKKQLEEMKKSGENNLSDENSNPEVKNGSVDGGKEDEILILEDAIQKQGDEIREMKSKGQGKDAWGPLVTELLELKSRLAKLKPPPPVVKKTKK